MTLYAEVVLSLPLDQSFTYLVPPQFQEKTKIGSRVLVPFSQRILTGFIVKLRKRRPSAEYQLKEIKDVLDKIPVFSPSFLNFTRELSQHYYSSWGEILQASLPPSFLLRTERKIFLTEEGKKAIERNVLSDGERKILKLLQEKGYSHLFLKRKLKIKNLFLLLSHLEKKGLIRIHKDLKKRKRKKEMSLPSKHTQLEMDFSLEAQSYPIADNIAQSFGKNIFSPFLLFGSFKKRKAVYFYLIKKIFEERKKALFLVPEISITKTMIERFERKVGAEIACLHSRLSEKRREAEWRRIKGGSVSLVVGTRSALFSPLDDLGLIIVDEEHDESYYQQESPTYDARKGAWLRAKEESCVLVYGSASPSVEAFHRAKKRGYLLRLEDGKKERKVEIVDERKEKGIISQKVVERIGEKLRKGEPILIFLNRRGYASFLYCSKCNYIPRCLHCDIALTYHKKEGKLICHYCNYSIPKISICPQCGAKIIRKRGFGIEVIEEELARIFPQSKVVCFDTDLIKTRKEQEKILFRFSKGKIDILVGTQLLAHQVDLPSVSLVIILHPETTLSLSDFKASQKTFQSIVKMMNFADDDKGEIIIQTSFPDHFCLRYAALNDYLSYFKQEIEFRRLMNYPPFSYMVEVLFQGEKLRSVARKSREFSSWVKSQGEDIEILGPALSSVSRVRGKSRVQIILKTNKGKKLNDILRKTLPRLKLKKSVLIYN